MQHIFLLLATILICSSCAAPRPLENSTGTFHNPGDDALITQSLFNDKNATISEENIQKILEGTYKLPPQLRVAVVRLENTTQQRYYRSDEQYLKTQQSYLDLFSEKFRQSPRVTRFSIVPDLLLSKPLSFTNIREAAVRMQADIVVVYSITSDLYSKYKLFSKPDIKAFATTQLIILDVRTGLIPFSTIVTKDTLSQKTKEELDHSEAASRIQNEAVLLTIQDIGQRITDFLNKD